MHTTMLRCPSTSRTVGFGPAAAMSTASGAATWARPPGGTSLTDFAIQAAMSRPGTIVTSRAVRQPWSSASHTTASGATIPPIRPADEP
ncbi:hypothetical protein RKD19_008134 [Streptomyces canus]